LWNQSTHFSVFNSTSFIVFHDLRRRICCLVSDCSQTLIRTSVLQRLLIASAKVLASGLEPMAATGSIAGVADAAHGWFSARFSQAFGVSDQDVLASSVHSPALTHADMRHRVAVNGLPSKRESGCGGSAHTDELTSGLTRRQIAADLGVGMSTLYKWVMAHLLPGNGLQGNPPHQARARP